ncbi:MAG: efflux RND transporter periplasmic adaptor subunit [Alphaproteobacteria bacterium]
MRAAARPRAASWWRQLVGVAVIGGLGAAGWLLFEPPSGDEDGGAGAQQRGGRGGGAPVVTAPVALASAGQILRAVGTGEALRSVTLFPAAAGEVEIVLFTAGEAVQSGDPLIALDDAEEALAVELARLQVQEQERTVARNDQLLPSGAVSSSAAQSARTALAEARNRLAAAELALERRTLLAPFAGVMGLTDVAEGDRVTTTTEIATIDDRSALLIRFEVPERFAAQVALGQDVRAETTAMPGTVFAGRITAIDSRLDPESRTLPVQATLPNPDDRLRAGMSFAVTMAFAEAQYPGVPEMAVQWSRDGPYVWRVADGTVEQVPVSLVERTAGTILVDGALVAGDRVVVEGTQRLRPGRPVEEAGQRPAGDAAAARPAS